MNHDHGTSTVNEIVDRNLKTLKYTSIGYFFFFPGSPLVIASNRSSVNFKPTVALVFSLMGCYNFYIYCDVNFVFYRCVVLKIFLDR